jgi:hypothetical protein
LSLINLKIIQPSEKASDLEVIRISNAQKKGTLAFYNGCNVENITLISILPKKTGTTVISRLQQQGEETFFHESYIVH